MNPLIDYLREIILRLSTKSPKFFKVIQIISGALALAMWIPATLQYFGIILPDSIAPLVDLVIAKCATVAFIIAMLTTKSTPVGITEGGQVLKSTNPKRLPFTAAAEQKSAENKDVPIVTMK